MPGPGNSSVLSRGMRLSIRIRVCHFELPRCSSVKTFMPGSGNSLISLWRTSLSERNSSISALAFNSFHPLRSLCRGLATHWPCLQEYIVPRASEPPPLATQLVRNGGRVPFKTARLIYSDSEWGAINVQSGRICVLLWLWCFCNFWPCSLIVFVSERPSLLRAPFMDSPVLLSPDPPRKK